VIRAGNAGPAFSWSGIFVFEARFGPDRISASPASLFLEQVSGRTFSFSVILNLFQDLISKFRPMTKDAETRSA